MNIKFPIDEHIPAILKSLTLHSSVIVKAEPGAGKTTRLPPALLGEGKGLVYVLEPRRLAARLSAERVAAEMGEEVGQTVGYMIRHDRQVSDKTRLIFLTEGLFLRLLRSNPTLDGVHCVVLDEFHERSIHVDLALAFVKKIQQIRSQNAANKSQEDLKLVIMSATLDSRTLETYLEDAKVFDISGKVFPVEIEYFAANVKTRYLDHMANCTLKILADQRCTGNILVFLTGIREIMDLYGMLRHLEPRIDVIPLAADMPKRDQQRAFGDSKKRKIILATNVAETSLTLPNVTGVVDSGFAKIAAFASWSGMPTLDIRKVSKASCIQRAGRAGRVAPGVVYRAFAESDFRGREGFTLPDIKRLDLTQTILEILDLSKVLSLVGDDSDPLTVLPWLEIPEEKAVESSLRTLRAIGAVDKNSKLLDLGHEIAKIPLHPRLGAMIQYALVKSDDNRSKVDGILAAAVISEGRVLGRRKAFVKQACDISFQVEAFKKILLKHEFETEAMDNAVDSRAFDRIKILYKSICALCGMDPTIKSIDVATLEIAKAVFHGYPDRVAKKRVIKRGGKGAKKLKQGPALYNFCLGRGGILAESSVLEEPSFLIAVDAMEQLMAANAAKGTMIHLAATITPEIIKLDPAGMVKKTITSEFNREKGVTETIETLSYENIVVEERVLEGNASTPEERLREILLSAWPQPFENADALDQYHIKIKLLEAAKFALNYPVFDGEMLELLVAHICDGKERLEEIKSRSLADYLDDQLTYDQQQGLRMLPDKIKLPNGNEVTAIYERDQAPILRGFIQDFYGVNGQIKIAQDRIPTVVELIGPNKRPTQKTGDLQGFWQGMYKEVMPALARRYPRHHWAADPETALPKLLKKHL